MNFLIYSDDKKIAETSDLYMASMAASVRSKWSGVHGGVHENANEIEIKLIDAIGSRATVVCGPRDTPGVVLWRIESTYKDSNCWS